MIYIASALLVVGLVILVLSGEGSVIFGLAQDDFASIVYSGALTLVIAFFLVRSSRSQLGRLLIYGLVWIGVFVGMITAYSFRDDLGRLSDRIYGELAPGAPANAVGPDGEAVVTVRRSFNGHFAVWAMANGARVRMLVDTGASVVTLTQRDAAAAGVDMSRLSYNRPVGTANGIARVAVARVRDFRIGSIRIGSVEAFVAPAGALDESLLGLNVLNALRSYEVRGDTLSLHGRT